VAATVTAVVPLVLIVFYLLKEGLGSLNLDLITQDPNRPGRPGGGFRNSIVGSGIMVGLALGIGVPIAVGCGVFLAEYGQGKAGTVIRFLVDVLAGIPSITVGLFVYGLIVLPQGEFTAFAGSVALAIILLPTVARITRRWCCWCHVRWEASLALGAPCWKTVTRIVLPSAMPGIITGIVLGLSRIARNRAIVVTALGNNFFRPTFPGDGRVAVADLRVRDAGHTTTGTSRRGR
jgi:phosphate transport system permease protein